MIYTYYIDVTQFEEKALFEEAYCLLSPYRKQKIAQFRQTKDRCRSLGAGIAFDHALAVYGLREREMVYEFGEWGKPFLKEYPDLHFSLSHSGAYAICSIGESPVGNDVERVRPGRLGVARRFFTPEELHFMYEALTEEEITERMFRIWTMKESFLKVTGRGMSLSLEDFTVLVEEEKNRVQVRHSVDALCYQMKEYGDIPGYRAAVCCREDLEVAQGMTRI